MRVILTKEQVDAVNCAIQGLRDVGFMVTGPEYVVTPTLMKIVDAYGQLVSQVADIEIEIDLDISTTINCDWEIG